MDAKPDGTGRPLTAEEVFQPWELDGRSRCDCLPDRAWLLTPLARASVLAGGLSFLCFLPAAVGLPLGVVTASLARRDLDAMAAGDMDQRGYHATRKAWSDARAGAVLSLLGGLVGFLPFLLLCALFLVAFGLGP
jgi:hypothetical protein